MRQFNVPQFIEVEDKIFGPLTLKQFIYLLGGTAAAFIIYVFGGMIALIILGLPIAGFSAALAFYKINNQPFIKVAANALSHYSGTKLYLWQKREIKKITGPEQPKETAKLELPKITEGKLKDLAWSLDVKEKIK